MFNQIVSYNLANMTSSAVDASNTFIGGLVGHISAGSVDHSI